MSSAPTSPRRDDETFDAWIDRVEDEILTAYEAGRFAPFAILDGPQGPIVHNLQWGEQDDVFFRRIRQAAGAAGATGFIGATTMNVFEAMVVLTWFAADADGQAHGLGQIYEGTVYTRVRTDPEKAPTAMQKVLS